MRLITVTAAVAAMIGFGLHFGLSRGTERAEADAFSVTEGMTKADVLKIAGPPRRKGPRCWNYRKAQPGTNVVGRRFCFSNGRVSLVQTSLTTGRPSHFRR